MYACDDLYCEGCGAVVDHQHLQECSVWCELRERYGVA